VRGFGREWPHASDCTFLAYQKATKLRSPPSSAENRESHAPE
jgi:hypothetical protein